MPSEHAWQTAHPIDNARELLMDHLGERSQGAHFTGCERSHWVCALRHCIHEIDALRAERAQGDPAHHGEPAAHTPECAVTPADGNPSEIPNGSPQPVSDAYKLPSGERVTCGWCDGKGGHPDGPYFEKCEHCDGRGYRILPPTAPEAAPTTGEREPGRTYRVQMVNGELDEVAGRGAYHLERLDDDSVYLGLGEDAHLWLVAVTAVNGNPELHIRHEGLLPTTPTECAP